MRVQYFFLAGLLVNPSTAEASVDPSSPGSVSPCPPVTVLPRTRIVNASAGLSTVRLRISPSVNPAFSSAGRNRSNSVRVRAERAAARLSNRVPTGVVRNQHATQAGPDLSCG